MWEKVQGHKDGIKEWKKKEDNGIERERQRESEKRLEEEKIGKRKKWNFCIILLPPITLNTPLVRGTMIATENHICQAKNELNGSLIFKYSKDKYNLHCER